MSRILRRCAIGRSIASCHYISNFLFFREVLAVKIDLIISYHPPIFRPLKKLTSKTWKVGMQPDIDFAEYPANLKAG